MEKHFLYCLTFPSGRPYIGITNNVARRLYEHKKRARQGSTLPVCAAIRKYGEDNVHCVVIATGTRAEVEAMEILTISHLDNAYNLAPGGGKSPMLSPEVQAKVRGRKHSPEHIENRAATQRGAKRSDESRARMSTGQKLRVRTPEEIERMRTLAKGRVVTPEHREKMRAAAIARWARKRFPEPIIPE